jgi:pseudomonalisin
MMRQTRRRALVRASAGAGAILVSLATAVSANPASAAQASASPAQSLAGSALSGAGSLVGALSPSAAQSSSRVAATRLAATGAVGAQAGTVAPAGVIAQRGATAVVPTVTSLLPGARDLGPVPSGRMATIGVFVSRPDTAGEQQLYEQLYDPASPSYGKFLSPSQFASRFGVPAARTNRVVAWLRAGGLSVDAGNATDGYLLASGTVGQMNRLLGVSVERYQAGSTLFSSNNRPVNVPAGLGIHSVVGLDSLNHFSIPALAQQPLRSPLSSTTASTFSGNLVPSDLWRLYNQPSGDTGQGQHIGVFGEGQSATIVDDLRVFEKNNALPKVPVRLVRTEPGTNADFSDTSGNIEWNIDTQASTGMAPGVSELDLYFSKSLTDPSVFASFQNWAADLKGPAQMNASFGECETTPLNALTDPLAQLPAGLALGNDLEVNLGGENILRQAAIEGRTLFSSSGDTGSGCPEVVAPVIGAGNGVLIQPVPDVNYPAASQFAVAVGGTVITTSATDHGTRVLETAWTFTGGGPAHFIPEPTFQKQEPAVDRNQTCISQPDGTAFPSGTICRGIPDVSALSGNVLGNGFLTVSGGQSAGEGGTSLSSPLWVGMWARVQAASPRGKGLGFAAPALYRAAVLSQGHAFLDITQAETLAGNGEFRPGPGWDYTSGLGIPDVTRLIGTLDARSPRRG